jgi:hypothetical protein
LVVSVEEAGRIVANLIDEGEDLLILAALAVIALIAAAFWGAFKDFSIPGIELPDWVKDPGGAIAAMPWNPTKPGDEGYDDPNYNPGLSEQVSNAIDPAEQAAYEATNPVNTSFVGSSIASNVAAGALIGLIPDDILSDPGAALAGAGIF